MSHGSFADDAWIVPAASAGGIAGKGISMNFTAFASPPFLSIQAIVAICAMLFSPETAITPLMSLASWTGDAAATMTPNVGALTEFSRPGAR